MKMKMLHMINVITEENKILNHVEAIVTEVFTPTKPTDATHQLTPSTNQKAIPESRFLSDGLLAVPSCSTKATISENRNCELKKKQKLVKVLSPNTDGQNVPTPIKKPPVLA